MTLAAPLAGKLTVTSRFGKRPQVPGTKADTTNHLGTDLRAPVGTPCLAPADGVVYAFRQAGRYYGPRIFTSALAGNWIVLWHPPLGIYVNYAHMQGVDVALGAPVKTGQQVGRTGNTGGVAPHLHAGVWTRIGNTWTAHDPESFFDFTGKANTPATTDKGFLMALTDAEQAEILAAARAQWVPGQPYTWVNANGNKLDALAKTLDTVRGATQETRDALLKPDGNGFRPIDVITSHAVATLNAVTSQARAQGVDIDEGALSRSLLEQGIAQEVVDALVNRAN